MIPIPSDNKPKKPVDKIIQETVNQLTEEESAKAKRFGDLSMFRVTTLTKVPEETYAISIECKGAVALGDIHAIKAKQKVGKTTVLKVIASAILNGQMFRIKGELENPTILVLDTEQKLSDVKLFATHVKELTGLSDEYINSHLFVYALRTFSYETMITDMELLIKAHGANVVMVDGIVDFVANFNDVEQSKQLVDDLLRISTETFSAIVTVLHTNKALDDHNMRGHLGTMIAQRAGNVLECEKDTKTGIITVKCPDHRHEQLPEWSIRYDKEGHIVSADSEYLVMIENKNKTKQAKKEAETQAVYEARKAAVVKVLTEHGGMTQKELVQAVMPLTRVSETTVKNFIAKLFEDEVLHKEGNKIQLKIQGELFTEDKPGDQT